MSRRDDMLLLRDMLEHARLARQAAEGRSRTDLDTDHVFRAACERFVEIVGEAAARVSDAFRDDHPQIPWRQIVGTRNILIHGYAQVDLDVLWDIIDVNLTALIRTLEQALGD